MCLTENIQVLDKLCSHMTYSAVGCKLIVKESVIYIKVSLNRDTHKIRLCINQLTKML